MKRTTTDELLTLGMALYADKKTMEQRVRGIFARSRSANGALACAALFISCAIFGGFTTACVPVRETPVPPAATAAEIITVEPAALLSGEAGAADGEDYTETEHYAWDQEEHGNARKFVAPAVENIYRDDRGMWTEAPEMNASMDAQTAISAFLPKANAIFGAAYTADQMQASYYRDGTGNRASLWRIASGDGLLAGAVDAATFAFVSADYIASPVAALHESYTNLDALDPAAAVARVTDALGGTATEVSARGGSGRSDETQRRGWTEKQTVAAQLADGQYYLIAMYGDAVGTIYAVGVCPDADCMEEGVYWRADLERAETIVQVHPQDFVKGEPGEGDMPVEKAYDFYYRFVEAAGVPGVDTREQIKEPNATFYIDRSGARENYWYIEGEYLVFNLASRTGHMFSVQSAQNERMLGLNMALYDIPYEEMGNDAYLEATAALFTALFGEGSVKECMLNAVYDGHYCTILASMADGTVYEMMYEDGRIVDAVFYGSGPYKDPDWAADWLYTNTETGETFHMDW